MRRLFGFLAWGVLFVGASCTQNYSKHIQLDPPDVQPGGSLQVRLTKVPPEHTWTVEFAGRTYPMFAEGTSVRTFIGLSAEFRPGSYPLVFHQHGRRRAVAKTIVTVSSCAFPSENITLSEQKVALIKDPAHLLAKKRIADVVAGVSPVALWSGRFVIPTIGRLNTIYGMQRRVNKIIDWPYHKGMDIGAPNGAAVKASSGGRVVLAERFPIHGRTLIIDHGQGLFSVYLHLASFVARPGDLVKQGELVGKVGSDGFSTGPHLHWEFYVFGEPIDPRLWAERDFGEKRG